jgi:hypothetical protein
MYKQNTTSNECSDQISAESDGLIGSYGIADRDPKRGDINFFINRTTRLICHRHFSTISSSIHDFGGSFGSPDAGLPSEEILDGN